MQTATHQTMPLNDANRLGLDYRAESARLPYGGPILDAHVHLGDVQAAELFFQIADLFHVQRVCTMTNLEVWDDMAEHFGDRVVPICIPNYMKGRDDPTYFTTDWLRRIEDFRGRGSRIIKYWAAPRGRDLHPEALVLDSPVRRQGMKLAHDLGYRVFMVHVADPDTWFARKYTDPRKYGTKAQQYPAFEALMDEYSDVTWLAAHMAGSPEDLDFLQGLLDRHPNLLIDSSAAKWQVRELSNPGRPRKVVAEFFQRNRRRILFGTDIVANAHDASFDLFASRFWVLRTLMETDYEGASPIVDPDLHMMDESVPEKSTAHLRGLHLPGDVLADVYHHNTARMLAAF